MHTVASVGFLFTLNYVARNHELKIVMFYFHSSIYSWGGSSKQLGNVLFTICGNKLLSNVPICNEVHQGGSLELRTILCLIKNNFYFLM